MTPPDGLTMLLRKLEREDLWVRISYSPMAKQWTAGIAPLEPMIHPDMPAGWAAISSTPLRAVRMANEKRKAWDEASR